MHDETECFQFDVDNILSLERENTETRITNQFEDQQVHFP